MCSVGTSYFCETELRTIDEWKSLALAFERRIAYLEQEVHEFEVVHGEIVEK